ncbi:MAG TPA: hypothetical protein PL124_05015, partial [Candidatus Cloacimonadota bacterium]|nr:hypothetical protein [Candidatus Cloacimonadota bacterium]
MKTSFLVFLFTLMAVFLLGNLVEKQEFEHTQPDGSKLTLYVSGDEYYHRVHDAKGFTVLQHPVTGFACYAVPEGGSIVASDYPVGSVDPESLGITPGLTIDLTNAREASRLNQRNRDAGNRASPTGTINNILAFIRFHDQTEFPTSSNWASYNNIFNQTGAASLKDYYTTVSNSQLTINSNLYPAANGSGYVVSIQVSHDRGYYSPYNATTNPIGYQNNAQKSSRHSAWITEMIGLLNPYVPDGMDLDSDDDGIVDALTFIIRGSTDDWGDLLWPAHWTWGGSLGTMNGSSVTHYVLDFQGGIGLSVVCHEMGHMIGAPDLYHYYDAPMGSIPPWNSISPAYQWCLMDNDNAQQWLTYMKWKYGTWFASIPTITPTSTPTTYTLTAVDQSPYSCYKIQSLDPNQYYVLEYRRQSGLYDVHVPGSGLIITRVNAGGINGNSQGPPDEVYVYRPGGDVDSNGTPANAFYSSQSGRTEINNYTDPKPWTWVDTSTTNDGNLVIFDVGASGGTTITFKVRNEPYDVWTGATSSNWSVASNWSTGVPSATSDVIIPSGCARYPTLTAASECQTLQMETSTTLNISTQTLNVYGQMDIAGQLIMNFSAGRLNVSGDLNWLSGSTAQVTNSPEITIQGDMDFRTGSSVQLGGGLVQFTGSTTAYIRCYTAGGVYNLRSNKTSPAYLGISAASSEDLYVYGSLYVYNGSRFASFDENAVRIYGNLTSYLGGTLQMDNGSIRFDGASASSISIQPTDYLYNLTLAKTGTANVNMTGNLIVSGSVNIGGGVLNTNGYNLTLAKNWINAVGADGFIESTGQVILNGTGDQTINSENFNILILNKASGEMIVPSTAQISCQQYDWQAGAYRVDGGWFVVQDLIDNGIYGTITLNSGHIVYNQDVANWIDLRGNLTIHDGNFTVNGGSGPSYWPYIDAASITMDGGTLDFTGSGILVNSTPALTDNISGGVIRTPRDFTINRPDFNPTGGDLELYGSGDAVITSTAGSNIYSLVINKSSSKEQSEHLPVYYDRRGHPIPVTRTNNVTASTDLDLNGSFALIAGTFVAPTLMQVAGNWYNYNGPTMFSEGTGTVEFNGPGHQYCYQSEDFYTLNVNNGAALRLNHATTTVTCVNYDWTAGGIDVLAGTFTAGDLVDNGICGGFWNNTGGVINLHQDNGAYPDLNGYLYNYGGTYNIYGGNGGCYWSYAANAGITMT